MAQLSPTTKQAIEEIADELDKLTLILPNLETRLFVMSSDLRRSVANV